MYKYVDSTYTYIRFKVILSSITMTTVQKLFRVKNFMVIVLLAWCIGKDDQLSFELSIVLSKINVYKPFIP